KLCNPRAAEAPVYGKALVDLQGVAVGERDQQPFAAHVEKIFIVPDAVEAIAVGYLILVDEDLVRASERWRNDEAAALVVEAGKGDWGCGGFLHAGQLRPWGVAPCDADDGSWLRYRRGLARGRSGRRLVEFFRARCSVDDDGG